jgi:transposase
MAKRVRGVRTRKFSGNGNLKQTSEQEQISALDRKLKVAEIELDILKKNNRHLSQNGR